MNKPISPWTDASFQLPSPDGKWVAVFENHGELGMGAPTHGTLRIEPWKSTETWESCNPSMVWSDDSKYLAIPQWTRDRRQRVLLISTEYQRGRVSEGDYGVLEFHSFSSGLLRGIDSPAWQPSEIELDATGLRGQDFE